jgi:MFS family permease
MGPASLFNLNAYAFGVSALFTGIGTGIVPVLVLELTDHGPIPFLWFRLDDNAAVALVSLFGLFMAAVAQPLAGYMSDRLGKRTTVMAGGMAALAVAAFSLGFARGYEAILASVVAVQFAGNFTQGPANALLLDHVPPHRIGAAAGMLNVFKVAGAGVFVIIIFLIMDNYDPDTGRVWLWTSVLLVITAMLAASAWTVLTVRKVKPGVPSGVANHGRPAVSPARPASQTPTRRRPYYLFLASLAFVIAAMSAMQVYSLPFLKNAVDLAEPARAAAMLALIVAVFTALTAVPAGRLQDRFGHRNLIFAAGLLGGAGALLLLLADSLVPVMFIGILVGMCIGIFVSVTWAMANSLVRRNAAGRDLGLTSVAVLAGAALARVAGPGIDALNNRSPELGYQVLLGAIALAFFVSPVLLVRAVGGTPLGRPERPPKV